jgi:hypothetical protein
MARISETKPTLSEVKADLAARAQAYCDRTEEYCGTLNLENLNIHESPIGKDIPVYYEFAFEARMPAGCDIKNWGNEDGFEKLEDFIVAPIGGSSVPASGYVYDMIKLVKARRALDNGDRLSIKQIALLAGMTEKSVRNAIYVNGGNRLEGTSSDKSDTLVENYEAKCWLKGRRGFRETTYSNFDDQQPESLSHAEISKYIHDRLFKLYGGEENMEIAVPLLGWENDNGERLLNIFVNTSAIRPMDCENLAKVLKVDEGWFTEQVMRALFPRQMELAVKSALSNKTQVEEVKTGEMNHDAN